MPFTATLEDSMQVGGGDRGLVLLRVDAANAGGSTGGVIAPSDLVTGARRIIAWYAAAYTATPTTPPQIVKTYDSATYDADILTITTTADKSHKVFILCENMGG